VGWGVKTPTLFRKFFQFARVFKKKMPTLPKFTRPYKDILKPLTQKISGYAPASIP